jgi:hypothetical protein
VLEFEIGAAQDILSDREKFNPERLKKQLSAFRGKTILFRSYLNDGDGYFLCERLLSDATDSSVGIIGIDQCGGFTAKLPFTTGVGIYASDWETVSALSKILMASVAPSIVTGSIAPATIIFVGRKPWGRVGPFRRTIPVPPPPDTSNTNAKTVTSRKQSCPVTVKEYLTCGDTYRYLQRYFKTEKWDSTLSL